MERGRGGHRRPSIDSRRLEFIRHRPGEAIVSFATDPIKSWGPLQEAREELGWTALPLVIAGSRTGAWRDLAGRAFKAFTAFSQSPLLTSVFPRSKKPC